MGGAEVWGQRHEKFSGSGLRGEGEILGNGTKNSQKSRRETCKGSKGMRQRCE